MTTAENTTENKKPLLIGILLAAAALIAVLSALPSVQSKVRAVLNSEQRHVLAKINAYYGVDQQKYLVLKIRDAYGISVEIYHESANGPQVLKQKFEMLNDSDAFITLDKNSTGLALSDADEDGQLDIIAPSVDRNGNLRLNTFSYNNELGVFEQLLESRQP